MPPVHVDYVLTQSQTTCFTHTDHPLTEVKQGPRSWSYCGRCEAAKVRRFVDNMRDPVLKARFEAAL